MYYQVNVLPTNDRAFDKKEAVRFALADKVAGIRREVHIRLGHFAWRRPWQPHRTMPGQPVLRHFL